MLSYGGVPLTLPTPRQVEWLSSTFTLRRLFEFSRLTWPGPRTPWLTWGGATPDEPLKLGCLNWPRGASRFATFFAVVSDAVLDAIRAAGAPPSPLPLVMRWDDEAHGTTPGIISTDLWMLPALPLTQIGGEPGHSLLTLVDDRYWWWFREEGVLTVTEGTTTWGDLYAFLEAALGIAFAFDAIDAAYLSPSILFTSNYEYLPLFLDAVAFNVGQRILRRLDGTVYGRSVQNGAADVADNLALPAARSLLGGGFFLPSDVLASIPSQVTVSFPTGDVTAPYVATGATGGTADAVKQFHGAAISDGTNGAALDALAVRIGLDFGAASTQVGDWKFAGIVPWVPDVNHDAVEWVYAGEGGPLGAGEVSTRIIPAPWNDLTDQYLSTAGGGSGGGDTFITVNNLSFLVFNTTVNNTVNDFFVGGNSKLRVNATSNTAVITGFVAGTPGQMLIIWNVGAFPLVLAHESLLSLAANRILTPLGADYTLWPNDGVILEYDGVTHRWRFDVPTIGAGDAVLKTYAVRRLIFSTGTVYTDNGDGSGTVTVTGSASNISTTNQDATETTNPVAVIVCNNDLGAAKFARIHTTDVGAGVALFDWQGIQIYKSGTGLVGPEPDIELVSGTNVTITVVDDVANARIKVTIDAASGISNLVFNEVALAASYTLTGTFANVGFPALTLPTINKTYRVYASVSASLQTALAQGYVKIELWDATAGARIANSTRAVLTCPAATYLTEEGGQVEVVYVAPANNTSIQLFAKYITTGTFAAGQIIGADTNLGESVLGYVQLSY